MAADTTIYVCPECKATQPEPGKCGRCPGTVRPSSGASRWLPVVGSLREQIAMQRALSPEQPGVIRLSCFDAEDVLAAIEAAETYSFICPAGYEPGDCCNAPWKCSRETESDLVDRLAKDGVYDRPPLNPDKPDKAPDSTHGAPGQASMSSRRRSSPMTTDCWIACPHDVPPDPSPDERPPKPVAASGAGRRERGKLEGSGRAPDRIEIPHIYPLRGFGGPLRTWRALPSEMTAWNAKSWWYRLTHRKEAPWAK